MKCPPLNFCILGLRVLLNSDAGVCMVFCRSVDSAVVSFLGVRGGVARLI